MAYNDAEVLAGGLAHVPILIGFVVFLNSYISSYQNREGSSTRKEDTQTATAAEQAQRIAQERAAAEQAQRIAQERAAAESKNQDIDQRPDSYKSEISTPVNPPKSYVNSEKLDAFEKESNMVSTTEERLKDEVERLEAEAEFKKLEEQSRNKKSSNFRTKIKKAFAKINPWQIGAIALLAVGGTNLFAAQENNKHNPTINQSSNWREKHPSTFLSIKESIKSKQSMSSKDFKL